MKKSKKYDIAPTNRLVSGNLFWQYITLLEILSFPKYQLRCQDILVLIY